MSGNNVTAENIPLLSHGSDEKEELDEPSQEANEKTEGGTLENWQAIMHLMKAFVMVGILALPSAIHHTGLVAGPIFLLTISIGCFYGLVILGGAIKETRKRVNAPSLTYGQLSRELLSVQSEKLGHVSKILIDIVLSTMQLGFCVVYIIFIGSTMHKLINSVEQVILITACLPFILVLALIRNVQRIAVFASFANIALFVAIAIMMQYFVTHIKEVPHVENAPTVTALMVGFGQMLFGYEGVGLVPSLEKNLRNKDSLRKIIMTTLLSVIVLYSSFALLGYLCFGNSVQPSVALNLPKKPMYTALDAVYVGTILLSYPVQFLVPVDIAMSYVEENLSKRNLVIIEYGLRATMAILTYALAVLVPQLDNVMGLIGGFSGTLLTFVFPPLFHIICFWNQGLSKWQLVANILLFIFGIISSVMGTFSSLVEIIKRFKRNSVL